MIYPFELHLIMIMTDKLCTSAIFVHCNDQVTILNLPYEKTININFRFLYRCPSVSADYCVTTNLHYKYPERTTDHGQATGKLYHLRLRVECTLFVIYKAGREPTPYWWSACMSCWVIQLPNSLSHPGPPFFIKKIHEIISDLYEHESLWALKCNILVRYH